MTDKIDPAAIKQNLKKYIEILQVTPQYLTD